MKRYYGLISIVATALCFTGRAIASDEKIGVVSKYPSPSPDGKEVVFSADFDGVSSQTHLWISSLDGSGLRKIPTNSLIDEEPAWSPNGKSIAFSATNGDVTEIWVVHPDGKAPTQLTANGINNRQAAWSPDGSKIAFVSDRGGSNDVWLMNADGSQQARISKLPGQENHPSFSPAGDKIVFSETINDSSHLMTMNLDGSGLAQLTSGPFHDWDPSWGKNGIAFSSERDTSSEHWKIWIIQPDGSGLRKIGDTFGLDPVWMPDGRLLFTDPSVASNALVAIGILDPSTFAKRIVDDVQGYLVPIDIRPGKYPNRINPKSHGRVEIAILSTANLDAAKAVDQSTLTFGRNGDEKSLGNCLKNSKDANGDRLPDLTCKFKLDNTNFKTGDTIGVLRFHDKNGVPYEGRDAILITNTEEKEDFTGGE